MQFLQPCDAALHLLLEAGTKSLAAHAREPRDVLVCKPLAFQPQRFHRAPHVWMRVLKALVF